MFTLALVLMRFEWGVGLSAIGTRGDTLCVSVECESNQLSAISDEASFAHGSDGPGSSCIYPAVKLDILDLA